MLGYDKGIKPIYSDGKVLGSKLLNVYGITLGVGVGIELGSLYVSFDGYNYYKLEGLLLGCSFWYTNDKFLGSGEVIKMGSTDGKVLGT